MTDNSGDPSPQPIPDSDPWRKFKIVTKLGMHYDVLWQGEMKDFVTSIRLLGYFMNPMLYCERDAISHVLAIGLEQAAGEGATVTPLHPVQ